MHFKEIQVETRSAEKVTDWSVILASAYRLLLIGDEVQSGSPGPWTAWSQFPPSNPVKSIHEEKHRHVDLCTNSSCFIFNYLTTQEVTLNTFIKEIHFTFGALWPIGAWGPRRDLIAKRMICLLTKINSSTNTCKQKQTCQDRSLNVSVITWARIS